MYFAFFTSVRSITNICWLTHWCLVTHIYASVNWAINNLSKVLSPVRHQAFTWANADQLMYCRSHPKEQILLNWNQTTNTALQENAVNIVVCKMSAILSRRQCVKISSCTRMDFEEFRRWHEQLGNQLGWVKMYSDFVMLHDFSPPSPHSAASDRFCMWGLPTLKNTITHRLYDALNWQPYFSCYMSRCFGAG